ncbi:MAG TPA: hypothetical protein VF132_02315, partial [Rudaea sp.]
INEAEPIPAPLPTALYGFLLLMTAAAWIPLTRLLISANGGRESDLARALGSDWKSKVSVLIYASAVALAFFVPIVSCVLYVVVSAMWFIPDRRIEKKVVES